MSNSYLARLPQELLVAILGEAFPSHERFHVLSDWETEAHRDRRRELQQIVDDVDGLLPAMLQRAAQDVYFSFLQPACVDDLVRDLVLLRADPALGRAVRTLVLGSITLLPLSEPSTATSTDPLGEAYRRAHEQMPESMRTMSDDNDDELPGWVQHWGVPLTRFLQCTPGVSKLIVGLRGAAAIPSVEFNDNNRLSLTNLATLSLDQFDPIYGGGVLDTAGMLLRSCPNLQTLFLTHIDQVVGVEPEDKNENDNSESSCSSPTLTTKPALLTHLTNLQVLQNVRLTPGGLDRLLRVVGPHLHTVVVEVPGGGPRWKTPLMATSEDEREKRCYTSREILARLLQWTDSLRSIRLTASFKHEERVRRRELRTAAVRRVDRPSPCTSLLPRFANLEYLEINTVLFDGLFRDVETGDNGDNDNLDDFNDFNNIDDLFDDIVNVNMPAINTPLADNNIPDDSDDDSADESEGGVALLHALGALDLNPDGVGSDSGSSSSDAPGGGVFLHMGDEDSYDPNTYVSDKLAAVLPASLTMLVLNCPRYDAWLGPHACRPAVLGLLRAARQGRFPHLHSIVIDPAVSVGDATGVFLPDGRVLGIQAMRADGFVNETLSPRRAFAQATTHLPAQQQHQQAPAEAGIAPLHYNLANDDEVSEDSS